MEYTSVKFKDFYTLCGFVTDLEVHGFVYEENFFKETHDSNLPIFKWILIYPDLTFSIFRHGGHCNPKRHIIIDFNYNDVLFSILNQLPCK